MKLTINLETDSAAFYEEPDEAEIICLGAVTKAFNTPSGPTGCCGVLRDHNGNKVGNWVLDTRE